MDDQLRPECLERAADLKGVGDIELGQVQGQKLLAGQVGLEGAAELAFAARDSDTHDLDPFAVWAG